MQDHVCSSQWRETTSVLNYTVISPVCSFPDKYQWSKYLEKRVKYIATKLNVDAVFPYSKIVKDNTFSCQ